MYSNKYLTGQEKPYVYLTLRHEKPARSPYSVCQYEKLNIANVVIMKRTSIICLDIEFECV